jgi:DNA polymerase-3 subunit epsilon
MKRYITEQGIDLIDVPPRRHKNYEEVWRHLNEMKKVDPADDPDPAFIGRTFVFTGGLQKMVRATAEQLVVNHGGMVGHNITKKTNILVLGNLAYSSGIKDGKSSKWKKAEEYLVEGQDIEILSENNFYEMLGI